MVGASRLVFAWKILERGLVELVSFASKMEESCRLPVKRADSAGSESRRPSKNRNFWTGC